MIFKSNFPNSPKVNMVIDGVPVDYNAVESIEVSFGENAHDYARFTFVGLIPNAVVDYIGRPVFISIDISPTRGSAFYGYVGYVEPEAITRRGLVNRSPIQKAHIHCFGASYDMKQKSSRTWDNYTLPKLVEELANKYNYSFAVPNDSFVIPRLAQHQESDWELLVKACSMLGYRVTARKSHIFVYDPYKALAKSMPYAELNTLFESEKNVAYGPGRIMEFRGTFGQITPEGSSNIFKFETLDNSGNVTTYTTDGESMGLGQVVAPRFTDVVTLNTVSSESLRKYALANMRNRAPFHADAIVTGIPDLLPGSLVKLSKYDAKFDGFWLVKTVCHKVTRSNYITELTLMKDSTNEAPPTSTLGDAYKEPEEPVVFQDRWKAPVRGGYVYL